MSHGRGHNKFNTYEVEMSISLSVCAEISTKIIYGKYKMAIGKILRRIIERIEGAEIIEANACEDHIHMLVTIPPKMSVSKFMGILKGKSSLMIFDQFANLKYKYGNRHFWCRGYYVDTISN